MSTPQTETVRFAPDAWGVDAAGETHLNASRCTACGALFYPPLERCAACWAEPLQPCAVTGEGVLYSYTVVHVRRAGWPQPYALAMVDFPIGLRVFGQLDLGTGLQLRTGMRVRLSHGALRQDAEGRAVVGYRFVPVAEPRRAGEEG